MSHYRSNVADQEFLLNRVFPPPPQVEQAWSEFDPSTVHDILTEVARLAEGPLADVFTLGDRVEPVFNPADATVTLPPEVKAAYDTLMEAEYWRLELPESLGGSDAPPSLRWSVAELLLGANPPLYFYMAGPLFAAILHELGTDDQKVLAQLMVDNQWGSTMVLTEPDAGSDVGAGRTVARLQPDGTWHIDGVKRFITSGDHNLADNIVHLVLARPVGVDGVGGPGTKGLSLFAVPKFHVDLETGQLGERNGAFVTGMEHKHGLTASATCEVSFGQAGVPAVGTLVGDVHDGIAQMFRIIEYARMMVGTKAISTLSTAYLNAVDYATTRVQGSDIAEGRDGGKVAIIRHPEVRNLLLRQKAYAEGLRALVVYTARWQDRIGAAQRGYPSDLDVTAMEQVNDLLLPIVKGVGSERAYELLTSALQVFGGSGYLKDYPIEQYCRDARIDTLYEGTTEIQAQDFLYRKVFKNQFAAWSVLVDDLTARLDAVEDSRVAEDVAAAKAALATCSELLVGTLAQWALIATQQDQPDMLHAIGFSTVRTLMTVGDTLVGVFLTLAAAEALYVADSDDSLREWADGKAAASSYFAATVLPTVAATASALPVLRDHYASWMALPPKGW